MARAMGRIWIGGGHEVALSLSRDPEKLKSAAQAIGAQALTAAGAAAFGDVVVLATTWEGAKPALQQAESLDGKLLWSIVNPLKPDFTGLEVGTDTSGSEQIAALVPGSRFAAAWPPFAEILAQGPAEIGGQKPTAFVCGEDGGAKQSVSELLLLLGAEPIDAGPLYAARFIEPAMMLLVHLAYGQGMGQVGTRLLTQGRTQ